MKMKIFITLLISTSCLFAGQIITEDSIVVQSKNDTVIVFDYNAWEQCAFQLQNIINVADSVITITQVDTAFDMTTCYGYHNFVTKITDLPEGLYRIDIFRDCLYQDVRFITSVHYLHRLVSIDRELLPQKFMLENAFPNPFGGAINPDNQSTTIKYSISNTVIANSQLNAPTASSTRNDIVNVTLKVFDILGREVATLVNENQPSGNYEVKFNAMNLPSGVYFSRLSANGLTQTKKMILLK